MADNVTTNPGSGGAVVATDEINGAHYQRIKVTFGPDGTAGDVSASNRLPVDVSFPASTTVTGPLTDAQLRAAAVPVSGTFWQATQPVSIAAPVAVTGNFWPTTQPVSIADAVAVTGPLTDAQLRASPVSVAVGNFPATQPISAASLPLPNGAATQATLQAILDAFHPEDSAAVSGDLGILALAQRQIADTTSTDADGDYTAIKIDEEGRVKVSSKPASYSDITGDITAVQATIGTPVAGGTVAGDVSRASNVMAFCTGTFAGVNCTFEGSLEATGDANWFGLQAVRTNANTIETATGALSAVPAYAWELSVNGLRRVRVRCTARTSGTQSWRFVQGTYATEPIPAAQVSATQPVSGTVTATVGTSISGGTISPLTVAGVTCDASAARTATGNGTTITNASARGASFFINVSAASGTSPTLVCQLQFQDPVSTNWVDVPGAVTATITGTGTTMLTVFPGIVEAANSRVSNALPRVFRWRWTIGGTTPSFTFSIGAAYII